MIFEPYTGRLSPVILIAKRGAIARYAAPVLELLEPWITLPYARCARITHYSVRWESQA